MSSVFNKVGATRTSHTQLHVGLAAAAVVTHRCLQCTMSGSKWKVVNLLLLWSSSRARSIGAEGVAPMRRNRRGRGRKRAVVVVIAVVLASAVARWFVRFVLWTRPRRERV
jgi:hypothetical protein